ncbi:MAG: hypothetical protein JSW07_19305 [bacterium]|nr:MAG: hypothetical protein JSW07_19305 [bacterium]
MSVKKTTGLVILTIGLVILFISATADLTRIGNLDGVVYKGFGYKQIGGTIIGIIIAVVGSILRFKKSKIK